MTAKFSRAELVERMVKAGEAEVSGAPPEEIASYFDTETFRFHGPDVTDSKSCGPGVRGNSGERRVRVRLPDSLEPRSTPKSATRF